jgi:hypothetical protein
MVHQIVDDYVFVAWVSKYCDGGTPLYTLGNAENLTANEEYFADLEEVYDKNALYLYDLFGVAGAQGSVNYTLQGHPEIGEIPYSCVWTARGKLIAGDDPATTDATELSYFMWTKPERLTSGARDANLPAVDCASGGCMMTWQEDPAGLRPGQGLGPGEGWSGAIANAKTDIWYSYISYEDFDIVFDELGTVAPDEPVTMDDYALLGAESMPKVYVPMAMPVRLTDNNMCKASGSDPYCYIDFDNLDTLDLAALPDGPDPAADFCADTYVWDTPDENPETTVTVCVTEDGRILNGRVASTRVRLNLKPYTKADGTPSGWVVMAAEETKALGDIVIDDDDTPIDIGKDVWYYSFDMAAPYTPDANLHLVEQGGMLNQPAVCRDDTELFCTNGADNFYDVQVDEHNGGEYYLTEIARRFALTTNSVQAAVDSTSGLAATLIYKQGIINQGGPADIFVRRLLVPDGFNEAEDNPYAFENMDCDEWVYTDGGNPNYLQGLCLSPAINISGSTVVRCDGGDDNDTCRDQFPVADDGSMIDGEEGAFPKVYEWRQLPYTATSDGDNFTGDPNDDSDLDDQSWENPFDVAKGHRGFLDGDFVMLMYAWAPNWKSNSVGNDHYNLYVRRSFDGGLTWTTGPLGTTATENYYGATIGEPVPVDFTYGPGADEQARNVSQLTGNKVTVLDPRYSPTGGTKLYATISSWWLEEYADLLNFESDDTLPYTDDAERDPSKFFMVYETGDNTTVAEGEAVPMDLFFSRATEYGDVWELDPDWYTIAEDGTITIEDYRWPWLENKADELSGEAGMLANPGGTFMYAVWNQWKEEILPDGHELIYDSDMIYRRLLYLPDDSETELSPIANILYVSTDRADYDDPDIVLIGSARDLDRIGNEDPYSDGIDNVRWWSDIQGHLCSEKTMKAPPNGFIPGKHAINFEAQDNEGNWSQPKTVTIWIAEQFYDTYLPLVTR